MGRGDCDIPTVSRRLALQDNLQVPLWPIADTHIELHRYIAITVRSRLRELAL